MKFQSCAVVLCLCFPFTFALRKQGVAVRGKLLCGTSALRNVRVKIVDQDSGPNPDDMLDEGYTDNYGNFKLDGSTRELSTIDARLKIYHDCNDKVNNIELDIVNLSEKLQPCQRKVVFKLPSGRYHGGTAKQTDWIDVGEINMEIKFKDEERDCSH